MRTRVHLQGRPRPASKSGRRTVTPARLQRDPSGADVLIVHRVLRTATPLALAAAALLALPVPGAGAAPPAAVVAAPTDLPRLQAELEQLTARAVALAGELDGAAARDGGLRVQLDRLAEQQDAARARVSTRARQAYVAVLAAQSDPMARLVGGLAAPDLRALADAELTRRGAAAAVRTEGELAGAVGEHAAATRQLQESADAYRAQLRGQAEQALAAQEAARLLLARAERAVALQQARAAAGEQTARQQAQQTAALDAARASLAASRASLSAASAAVTTALTPAQTRRSNAAATREAPVLALVEAAGAGYPQGYRPTGQVQRGVASWYGPGFVGNPTASGTPYDPERLTCAHRTLPLGTVLHVTRGNLAINCLVNDRGPYSGGRILDLSRAGSRALGFDGVAEVALEVLTPTG